MAEEQKYEFISIKDSRLWRSILSDTYSTLTLGGLIGVGVVVDSGAMQWAGFLFAVMWMFARVSNRASRARKTAQEAANYLRDKYGVVPTPPASGGE